MFHIIVYLFVIIVIMRLLQPYIKKCICPDLNKLLHTEIYIYNYIRYY